MKQDDILEMYKPLVRFIAQVCGPSCEVLLHDLRDIEHSIVAIENGQVTGRKIGDTMTDFGLRSVFDEQFQDCEFVTNYEGSTRDGEKVLKSSTFYIRDDDGKVIALLCTNTDITDKIALRDRLDQEIRLPEGATLDLTQPDVVPHDRAAKKPEKFTVSMDELVEHILNQTMSELGFNDPVHMLPEEKRKCIRQLNARNLFLLKGAVGEVAKYLRISEPTVYRYLRSLS